MKVNGANTLLNGTGETVSIAAILASSSSGYALDIFTAEEVAALEIFQKRGKIYLKCCSTGKERPAKPEEIVRQLYLRKLILEYGYPEPMSLSVEKAFLGYDTGLEHQIRHLNDSITA
jgi:type I restriction enzyme M protein